MSNCEQSPIDKRTPTKFLAVGYINYGGIVKWEPEHLPGDHPNALLYVVADSGCDGIASSSAASSSDNGFRKTEAFRQHPQISTCTLPMVAQLLASHEELERKLLAARSSERRSERCATQGHVWVGTGDERVVCDDCGVEKPKFENVSCSQCGRDFGPGNEGFSRCADHAPESHERSNVPEGWKIERLTGKLHIVETYYVESPDGYRCTANECDLNPKIVIFKLAKALASSSATRRSECPYCTSDNEAIRSTYYNQTCEGCVKRMG